MSRKGMVWRMKYYDSLQLVS